MSTNDAVVYTSKVETWLIENLMKPALKHVPESVRPNTLSYWNSAFTWGVFLLAVASTTATPLSRALLLLGAGMSMFASMMLDCLDGMQARRTRRTSKLGELLDHGLDAAHIPLGSGAIIMALQVDAWALVVAHVTATMVYNAQLVLHHRTKQFVYPPTSGTEVQLGFSFGLPAIGALLYFVPRETPWVGWLITTISVVAIVLNVQLVWFFCARLGRHALDHVPFALACSVFGLLYWLGAMTALAFVTAVVFVSFRVSGAYVLCGIVGKRFSGFDAGITVFAATIAATHFLLQPIPLPIGGYTLQSVLPWVMCVYLTARNLMDVAKHYPALRPSPSSAAAA